MGFTKGDTTMKPSTTAWLAAGAAAILLSSGAAALSQTTPFTSNPAEVRAGTYALDSSHGNITWSVNHMGFSTYVGQFTNVEAQLTIDPANPAASTLTATIPLTDVLTSSQGLTAHLQTPDFFDAANHPNATFRSTHIVIDRDDPTEADVTGELTIRGVTRTVTMEVEFNQAGEIMGAYRVGFDGELTIRRSDFGITYGIPMGLGDEVELHIEGEFLPQS